MITVKFYGLLRVESGIKEIKTDCTSLKQLYNEIASGYPQIKPKDLSGSLVLINGSRAKSRQVLSDGDVVQFLSPSAGG